MITLSNSSGRFYIYVFLLGKLVIDTSLIYLTKCLACPFEGVKLTKLSSIDCKAWDAIDKSIDNSLGKLELHLNVQY